MAQATTVALDGGLLERAARGDAAAFDLLIRPRLDRLFRMAVAIDAERGRRPRRCPGCLRPGLARTPAAARPGALRRLAVADPRQRLSRAPPRPAPQEGPRDRDRRRARRRRRPRGVLHGKPKRSVRRDRGHPRGLRAPGPGRARPAGPALRRGTSPRRDRSDARHARRDHQMAPLQCPKGPRPGAGRTAIMTAFDRDDLIRLALTP